MDGIPPSQKQIAQKYDGNPGYFGKAHYFRKLRLWCFAVAAMGSLIAAATFHFWGSGRIFSKGPVSRHHARFANDCRACHIDAEIDALKALLSARPGGTPFGAIFATGPAKDLPAAWSQMDKACLKCHASHGLHLPQAAGLALRAVSQDLTAVHATRCFTCHREHAGPQRMTLPDHQTCASCHNNAEELRRSRAVFPLKNTPVASTGENRDLGDGLVRFLAGRKSPDSLPAFPDYAHGHPPFGYERQDQRDPADLKFNHARHQRADVVALGPNQKLACAGCHEPGPQGAYYKPVNFERHCQSCHSLQMVPDLPGLSIPHGDSAKVRYFLAGLKTSVEAAVRSEGVTEAGELSRRLESEIRRLHQRGLDTPDALEKRVFFEGDPREPQDVRRMRTGSRKFLTECAKCHTVTPGGPGAPPQVSHPNIAERWVHGGPFTHLPHLHMDCADCHGTARSSRLTSDILMPPQKLCAECHRPPEASGPAQHGGGSKDGSTREKGDPNLAARQRREGGIKWDCLSCHSFHAPASATDFTKRFLPGQSPDHNLPVNR